MWYQTSYPVLTRSFKVVSPSRGLLVDMHQVAPIANRSFCYEAQQQITSVCPTSSIHPSLGSRRTQSSLGGPGPIHLPTSSHSGQGGGETMGLPVQENHHDCSRVAQHASGSGIW